MEAIAQRGKLDLHTIIDSKPAPSSKAALWAGRVLSGIAILFMAFDCIGKVLELAPFIQGTTELGFPASAVRGMGLVELLALVLYVVPRTSVLGAVLLTGWFGGAIATHLRFGHPLFSHTLFPIYVALLVWGGLYARRADLRAVFPMHNSR